MAQISLQTTEKPVEKTTTRTATRLIFIDHLRAAVAILVVLFRNRQSINVDDFDTMRG